MEPTAGCGDHSPHTSVNPPQVTKKSKSGEHQKKGCNTAAYAPLAAGAKAHRPPFLRVLPPLQNPRNGLRAWPPPSRASSEAEPRQPPLDVRRVIPLDSQLAPPSLYLPPLADLRQVGREGLWAEGTGDHTAVTTTHTEDTEQHDKIWGRVFVRMRARGIGVEPRGRLYYRCCTESNESVKHSSVRKTVRKRTEEKMHAAAAAAEAVAAPFVCPRRTKATQASPQSNRRRGYKKTQIVRHFPT